MLVQSSRWALMMEIETEKRMVLRTTYEKAWSKLGSRWGLEPW